MEAIRLGISKPEDLEKLAVGFIAKFSLKNLSEEVASLLPDCINFTENPQIGDLNVIERRTEELLRKKLS